MSVPPVILAYLGRVAKDRSRDHWRDAHVTAAGRARRVALGQVTSRGSDGASPYQLSSLILDFSEGDRGDIDTGGLFRI